MSDLKQDLERIEDGIRKLKIQYELYFVGAEKMPPTKLHEDLDKLVRKYAGMSFPRPQDRFYFSNVQSRYNAYSELWNKQLKMREEGRLPGGRPALRGVAGGGSPAGRPGGGVPAGAAARPPAGRGGADDSVRISVETLEESSLRRLYERFGAARAQAGQADALPAYERFRDQVRAQLETLRQKGVGGQVEFRVSVQDSKVSLKARPVR